MIALKAEPDVEPSSGWGDVLWQVVTAAVPGMILLLGTLLDPNFTYNRWDNYEYFTSAMVAAHGQWLEGEIPFWNPHQHLGEPVLATMLPAVLYIPYTAVCALIRALGLPPSAFPLLVVVLHTVFAATGWYRLMRWVGARPEVGFLVGVSASLGGFVTILSSVWIYMSPICAWLPWLMRWTLEVVSRSGSRGSMVWLTAGLTAAVYVGQPQMAVYTWAFVGILGVVYWAAVVRRLKGIVELAGAAAVATLTSAPLWLPAYLYVAETARAGAVNPHEFLGRAVPPGAWADMLLPIYCYDNGFLPGHASVYLHQGAWVAPAILGGLAVAWSQRGRRGLGGPLAVALGCALLFYELAQGQYGSLLGLTYGLPIWSSFRDAFKLAPFFLAAAALAGGLGLEMCWRQQLGRGWLLALGTAVTVAASLIMIFPGSVFHKSCPVREVMPGWGSQVSLGAGLVVLLLACAGSRPRFRQILLVAAPLQMAGVVALSHAQGLKTYYTSHHVGARELGIDTQYRILPLSHSHYTPSVSLHEYGVFHSATANGYYSATGHYTSYMAPWWRTRWLHIDEQGVPAPPFNNILLGSHLLRSFNVRYIIAAKYDHESVAAVRGHPAYRPVRELAETWVYEDPQALPRVYFAAETRTYSAQDLDQGLLKNQAPLSTAYIEDWPRGAEAATGKVEEIKWGRREIQARVQAPAGGFLVISTTWDRGWRARVDNAPARLHRVNGTLLGLAVPPGARQVALRYTAPGFGAALGLFGAGIAALGFWYWRRR